MSETSVIVPWSVYADRYRLTPRQAKLFAYLFDGQHHSNVDCLFGAWGKKAGSDHLVPVVVSRLRKVIEPHGFVILSWRGKGRGGYQMVTAASQPVDA